MRPLLVLVVCAASACAADPRTEDIEGAGGDAAFADGDDSNVEPSQMEGRAADASVPEVVSTGPCVVRLSDEAESDAVVIPETTLLGCDAFVERYCRSTRPETASACVGTIDYIGGLRGSCTRPAERLRSLATVVGGLHASPSWPFGAESALSVSDGCAAIPGWSRMAASLELEMALLPDNLRLPNLEHVPYVSEIPREETLLTHAEVERADSGDALVLRLRPEAAARARRIVASRGGTAKYLVHDGKDTLFTGVVALDDDGTAEDAPWVVASTRLDADGVTLGGFADRPEVRRIRTLEPLMAQGVLVGAGSACLSDHGCPEGAACDGQVCR
jgi:hypothetical protein